MKKSALRLGSDYEQNWLGYPRVRVAEGGRNLLFQQLDGESAAAVGGPLYIDPGRIIRLWQERLADDDNTWRDLPSRCPHSVEPDLLARTQLDSALVPEVLRPGRKSRFMDLLATAEANGWCGRYGCTTCASEDFRSEIVRWALADPDSVAAELGHLTATDILHSCGDWLRIAMSQIAALESPRADRWTELFLTKRPKGGSFVEREILGRVPRVPRAAAYRRLHADRILSSAVEQWLPLLRREEPERVRLADSILFYAIRYFPEQSAGRLQWIRECVTIALDTHDESLVESLVWTLRECIVRYDGLSEAVRRRALNSVAISRAVSETLRP